MPNTLQPEAWGLKTSSSGELMVGNHSVVDLATRYGTPLHLVNEDRLVKTAIKFRETVALAYPGKTSVYYALKCNSVPGIVESVRSAGLNAEVMTDYELELAFRLGFGAEDVIVNGPCKTDHFLRKCIQKQVRLIVVDSLAELKTLAVLAQETDLATNILLRINPDYVPRKMNRGTATGSRKGCAFGLDLIGGEVVEAINLLKQTRLVNFLGYHFHIGTGIQDPKDYSRALRAVVPLIEFTRSVGFNIKIFDIGGGFASTTTRELTTRELLVYQGFNRLPNGLDSGHRATVEDFAKEISNTVRKYFPSTELPELLYEPGRCIVSPNQFLLLTVHRITNRPGIAKWLITDGGLSTVTMPTYYEYHEVLLCNDVNRPRTERVTIIGPACFAGDIVYRNKRMPEVRRGEIIAIMDSGAYFTALESSFGFPRPAIVAINGATYRLIRNRETFENMIARDIID